MLCETAAHLHKDFWERGMAAGWRTREKHIVVLTGSGISAESGIATFRDKNGIWAKYDVEEVATPTAFARNPARVHEFYNMRRKALAGVRPNAAHLALARLEREYDGRVEIITQNVDPLHELAGSRNILHMHGELLQALCAGCGAVTVWHDDLSIDIACPSCGRAGGMRPNVVWFGEMPYHMDKIADNLAAATQFVSIGTSGNVYPAAGFVAAVRANGTPTLELNLEPSEGTSLFDEAIHGPASVVVPAWVERVLAGGS
jgi:NAD-dependent deacetylase